MTTLSYYPLVIDETNSKNAPGQTGRVFLRTPVFDRPSSVLELERDVELGAIGFNLAFGIKLQIELDDFGDAEISQGFAGPFDGGRGRLLP